MKRLGDCEFFDGEKMDIKALEKSFKKRVELEKNKKKKEKQLVKNEEDEINRHKSKENNFYTKKLVLAKKIFKWRDELLSTKVGREILKENGDCIIIYEGSDGYLNYSGQNELYIVEDGIEFNYGWMMKPSVMMETFSEMAKSLNYDYILKVWKSIESGKTEKLIMTELERDESETEDMEDEE